MSLNRYHNSRSSDNVFKLLHEENTYLDLLKGNVKAMHKDQIEEDKGVGPHQTARKQLLQEQARLNEADPGMEKVEDASTKEPAEDEGTPEQQANAAEEAAPEGKKAEEEMGVKEDVDELDEISLAVARQAAQRSAMAGAAARKGALMGKGPLSKFIKKVPKKKVLPGLRG